MGGGGRGRGVFIFWRKNTSICSLLNLFSFLSFSRFCNDQQPHMVRITFIC